MLEKCSNLTQICPLPPQVLQSSDLPAGLVNVITGNRDQLTAALANHSVIKAVWYWGSAEVRTKHQHIHQCSYLTCGKQPLSPALTLLLSALLPQGCQYLQHTCTSPLKVLRLSCQKEDGGKDWSRPSVLEEMWRHAVQWKSVWIPSA